MRKTIIASLGALALLPGCSMDGAADGVRSAGSTAANGVTGVATSLINVDLSNVLNDLALDLKVDKSNIPINAQVPVSVAANVCGISINILTIGGGGTAKGCAANTASPELVQAVQQQLAAQGSVGGGAQTGGAAAPVGASTTAGTAGTTPTAQTATGTTPGTGTTTGSGAGSGGGTAPLGGATPAGTMTTTAPSPTPTPAPQPTPAATPRS